MGTPPGLQDQSHASGLALASYHFEPHPNIRQFDQGSLANQSLLSISPFEVDNFLEGGGFTIPSFGHDCQEIGIHVKQEAPGQGSVASEHPSDSGHTASHMQAPLESLLCPAAIEKILGEVGSEVSFPDIDLSGTWDMGMQGNPHFFAPQFVDEMPPIPALMPGVDLSATGTMLPLNDMTVAEMPPNVTVTLKGKRSQPHASLSNLSKVLRRLGEAEVPPMSVPAARDTKHLAHAATQPPQTSITELQPQPQQPHVETQAAASYPLPVQQKQRQPETERLQKPAYGPSAAAVPQPPPAAAAAASALQGAQKRPRLGGALQRESGADSPPQRKLRRKGDVPERLAAILENERSLSFDESDDSAERSRSAASPSKAAGQYHCKLSKAAIRAQGTMYSLTDEEVMEVECELPPSCSEEERTHAYKRARNRSAARKTRRKKCENLMELEQEVMLLGQQNSSLIYDLNNIIAQVEDRSRENERLKGLLRVLQLQPEAAAIAPTLVNLEQLKNSIAALTSSGAAAAAAAAQLPPKNAAGAQGSPGKGSTPVVRSNAGKPAKRRLSEHQVHQMAAAALAENEGDASAALSQLVTRAFNREPAE